ncbi:putative lipid II flippase FtsW [Candidatus Desantisbacteria bacterium]|nr:putative lipid II flippase FtsW [Candidatus Desantisbacteria bacterium]
MLHEKPGDYPDKILFIVTLLLTAIGIVMIYGPSAIISERLYKTSNMFLFKQFIGVIIGLSLMWIISKVDIYNLKRPSISIGLLITSILLLILVLIPKIGKEANGARRWINLYLFTIQPSEIAKLSIIIYLADTLSRKQKNIDNFTQCLLPIITIVCIMAFLIKLEPDFGSMIILSIIVSIMLFTGGISFKYILPMIISSSGIILFWIIRDPLRWRRILSIWSGNYQLDQSLLALRFGGLLGVGLGNSRQKFFYLPEAHNDFIFAIIGEELGLIGTVLVLLLFIILIWRGVMIASRTNDLYQGLLATGIVTIIGLEASINMGVVMGILPTKGITLPFVSYGVSSLVVNLIAVGILLNISKSTG